MMRKSVILLIFAFYVNLNAQTDFDRNNLAFLLKPFNKHNYCNSIVNDTKFDTIAQNELFQTFEKLKLVSQNPFKQMVSDSDKRFDLSGIVANNGHIYVIADKEWNNHIYKVDTSGTTFTITSVRELCAKKNIDFEGIDACNNKFLIIDESKNNLYICNLDLCQLIKIKIPWEKYKIDDKDWGNKGLEGVAFDCTRKIVYLAKEREPRRIFAFNLVKKTLTEPFADIINSNQNGFDAADMKFENECLYILERGRGLVTKIDIKTNKITSVSFQHIVLKDRQRLYNNDNPDYGMAEALLLTKDQIWIGIDNNGDEVSEYGKSLGLKAGNKPVIIIFERPKDF